MTALDLTGRDLVRVLADAARRPSVDRAVRDRAAALVADMAARGQDARLVRLGSADYAVTASRDGEGGDE